MSQRSLGKNCDQHIYLDNNYYCGKRQLTIENYLLLMICLE